MILETNEKRVELRFSTKKIIALTKSLKSKNLSDIYFKAIAEEDIEKLLKIIQIFAEDENGNTAFTKLDDACDFIDKYMKEKNKTYIDLYNELGDAINDEGFFQKKFTKEELTQEKSSILYSMDINELIQKSVVEEMQRIAPLEEITQMKK